MSRQLANGLMVRLLLLLFFAFSSVTTTAKERITYFHNDLLGSPVAATNIQGEMLWQEEYTAYGKRLIKADQGRNSRWFTGKPEIAALGVQYFDARWYDADLGRFLSIDPVDFQEGDTHSFNRYAYANNSPYRYVDPDGRMSLDINKPRTYGTEGVVSFNGGGMSNVGPSSGIRRGILPNGDFVESAGRAGKQARFRELANDDKLGSADRGWIRQEMNSIERGQRSSIRNPPGKDLAHERGREAAKGYSYKHSNLQDRGLHRLQHKYDNFGRKNKERTVD